MSNRLAAAIGKTTTEVEAAEISPPVDVATFKTVIEHLLESQRTMERSLLLLANVVNAPIQFGDRPVETISANSGGFSAATREFATGINARSLARKRIADLLEIPGY